MVTLESVAVSAWKCKMMKKSNNEMGTVGVVSYLISIYSMRSYNGLMPFNGGQNDNDNIRGTYKDIVPFSLQMIVRITYN